MLLAAGCAGPASRTAPPASGLPDGLGSTHFAIGTQSPIAQSLFDQGLVWCFAFHHDEAMRCFRAAAASDPACAMAYWGLAYAAGPHINNMEMSEARAKSAHEDAQRARALAAAAPALERDLIDAVCARYTWPAPADRRPLDVAYATAMRAAYGAHPDHPHVTALFVEALMDLRPWDLWKPDGAPQPGTLEIVALLEKLLVAHPDHPQANHLYIHAVEASPTPERAVAAAERLGTLVPGAGHLVHMPAHIWIRGGRYDEAILANQRGIEVDRQIVARTGRQGFYEIYRAHNFHFLCYAAMFDGRSRVAFDAARSLVAEIPDAMVQALPKFLDAFVGVPLHVLVRFGRFDEILREPQPPAHLPCTTALWHYARGIALANLDRGPEAAAERLAFARAKAAVPEDFVAGHNSCRDVLAVGEALLDGEVLFREGQHEAAFAALRLAVERDDALRYDEPWGWMMPARHALGALLLESGATAQAEAVYRRDLERHPGNGWALRGLERCLRARNADATPVAQEFARAWRRADVEIRTSCFCGR